MSKEYKFLKKQRYEYYKGTSGIVDNELDDFVDDVVERLNTQDFNKLELLKVKQIQDEQIAELKTKLAEKDQDKISFAIAELEKVKDWCKEYSTEDEFGVFTINVDDELNTEDNLLNFIDNQINELKEKQNG